MLFMFSTIAQAAESDVPDNYKNLTVVQKMRMPVNQVVEKKAPLSDRLSQIVDQPAPTKAVKNNLPNVAVLYINNSKSTYNDEVDMRVLPSLGQALPAEKYNLIDGAIYIERLSKVGIADLSTAERADILEAFRGDDIDYIVILEIQPFVARDKLTFFTVGKDITTAVPFKIIDVVNGRYLYNGKFTEKASSSSMIGGIGNKSVALKALDTVNTQIASVIETRLPQTKPVPMAINPNVRK